MSAVASDTAILAKRMREETIWDVLNRDLFFVKDAVKPSEAKFSDKLDIYDPEQQRVVMEGGEPEFRRFMKVSRFYGGTYDRSSGFVLAALFGDSRQQGLRGSWASGRFVLNAAPF